MIYLQPWTQACEEHSRGYCNFFLDFISTHCTSDHWQFKSSFPACSWSVSIPQVCCLKGFICEICKDEKVIFAFDVATCTQVCFYCPRPSFCIILEVALFLLLVGFSGWFLCILTCCFSLGWNGDVLGYSTKQLVYDLLGCLCVWHSWCLLTSCNVLVTIIL